MLVVLRGVTVVTEDLDHVRVVVLHEPADEVVTTPASFSMGFAASTNVVKREKLWPRITAAQTASAIFL